MFVTMSWANSMIKIAKKMFGIWVGIFFIPLVASDPEISIILTVYNKEHQVDKIIHGILNNTISPFEFIIVYDGCTDRSQEIAENILHNKECKMLNYLPIHTPDVNETRANNAGMKAASGKYFILLQDDMEITEKGWDQRLIKPMKRFNDVFAVSAMWGANYAPFSLDSSKHSYVDNYRGGFRDKFVVRDVICRGPIAVDAAIMKQLNYFDETYAPLYLDDHDLCVRAYQKLKKVCGVYKIGCRMLEKTCHGDVKMSNGQYFRDVIATNRQTFWNRYKVYFKGIYHNEIRDLQ